MQNSLIYKDILTLIFGNKQYADYFKKYYGDSRNYQVMYRDYIKQIQTGKEGNSKK